MSLSERLTINLLYPVLASLTSLESLDSRCVEDNGDLLVHSQVDSLKYRIPPSAPISLSLLPFVYHHSPSL
jgi:hypothetical protein